MEQDPQIESAKIVLTTKGPCPFGEGTRIIIDGQAYWVTKVVDPYTLEVMPEPGPTPGKDYPGWWWFLIGLIAFGLFLKYLF